MLKPLLFLLLLILTSLPVIATEWGYQNEQTTLWADYKQGGQLSNVKAVNITITYPNGTVHTNNSEMVNVETGKYKYNLTPNVAGIWHATAKYFNDTYGIIDTGSETISILESKEEKHSIMISAIMALLGVITLFGFLYKFGMERMKVGFYLLMHFFTIAALFVTANFIESTSLPTSTSTIFYTLGSLFTVYTMYVTYMILWNIGKNMIKFGKQQRGELPWDK